MAETQPPSPHVDRASDPCAGNLASPVVALEPTDTAGQALARMRAEGALCLPVVVEGAPLGLVWREQVLMFLAADRGRGDGLQARVTRVMDTAPPVVDAALGVLALARVVVPASRQGRGAAIVTRDGQYLGLVHADVLMEAMALRPAASSEAPTDSVPQLADPQGTRLPGLAVMAHEIRTPLSGMIGLIDLLSQARLDAHTRGLVTTLGEQGRAMNALLSNLIDLSRLETGSLAPSVQDVDLVQFLKAVTDAWRPSAAQARLTLTSSFAALGPDRVRVDPVRLRQIADNLIGNAIKFTQAGEVAVMLESLRLDEGIRLRLEIVDTGPGLPDSVSSRLFQPQMPSAASGEAGSRGSGLGLAIVRGLASALGGQVAYRQNAPRGSRFVVDLPADPVSVREEEAFAPRPAARAQGLPRAAVFRLGRVLLVEDHPVNQMVIAQTLRSAGWQVDAVGTVEHALRRGAEVAYQAVLCDLYLPDGQGFQVARVLGAAGSASSGAVLMALTADTDPEILRACGAAGFVRVAHKPVDPGVLVSSLADAILEAETYGELRAAG